ncbi:lipoyl synthase [bacterium]|nr:lipoyl synthase [bacterium]
MQHPPHQPKPNWLRVKLPSGGNPIVEQQKRLHSHLTTVCEEARCPNMGECWNSGTATFMLMGDTCTRGCRFCSVKTAKYPPALDPGEPGKLADTVKGLKLKYVVLTTVDRDDLPDQGSGHISLCIDTIKKSVPGILVEALIPDFQGNPELIARVAHSSADVIGHNVECVRRLTQMVRDPRAGYDQSLDVLRQLKKIRPAVFTKSSLMLGFGETDDEVLASMADIRATGAEFCTLGQYLQPDRTKLAVTEYIHPDKFKWYEQKGLEMGFEYVASGPLVRSSYQAGEHYLQARLKQGSGRD